MWNLSLMLFHHFTNILNSIAFYFEILFWDYLQGNVLGGHISQGRHELLDSSGLNLEIFSQG